MNKLTLKHWLGITAVVSQLAFTGLLTFTSQGKQEAVEMEDAKKQVEPAEGQKQLKSGELKPDLSQKFDPYQR